MWTCQPSSGIGDCWCTNNARAVFSGVNNWHTSIFACSFFQHTCLGGNIPPFMLTTETYSIMDIIICDWACGHKLHPVTLKVISQYWNRVFLFCNLHNEFLLIAENFITIACWDKELWIQKGWINYVPTCPVLTCLVTYVLHTYTACTLANQILVVDNIWTLFTQKKHA